MRLKYRKLAVIGFSGVGKTSILSQFVDSEFTDAYDPTTENTYGKTIKVDGLLYRLELIDTAGQDELSDLPQNYCMNIDGWILVYSITSSKSFQVVKNLYERLEDKMGGILNIPIVLVGNKEDLEKFRVVTKEEGEALVKRWGRGGGGDTFMETSAKFNKNVYDVFNVIIRQHKLMDTPKKRGRGKRLSCFCFRL